MERQRTAAHIVRNIIRYELCGFSLIIGLLWMDEIFDLPALLLRADPTPVNIPESVLETLLVVIVALLTVVLTSNLLQNRLKGLLTVCSGCKRVRDERGDWIQMEGYISDHTSADFSHGICPECKDRLYPGM
jgi:hypothetical protein